MHIIFNKEMFVWIYKELFKNSSRSKSQTKFYFEYYEHKLLQPFMDMA